MTDALTTEPESLKNKLLRENREAYEDAARYRWLKERFFAADFDYGDPSTSVIVFEVPCGSRISRNLNWTIDQMMAPTPDDVAGES